jgi:hypothetical protein
MAFLLLNIMRFGQSGVVRPERKVIYVYEQKNQYNIIFAFLLLKGTFVTWQMWQGRLLATSNESPFFKNQMKNYVCGKKELIFVIICKKYIEICWTKI